MEIKIDTTKDSKEDIQKTIRFLQKLVDEDLDVEEVDESGGMFGIFDDSESSEEEKEESSGNPMNMFDDSSNSEDDGVSGGLFEEDEDETELFDEENVNVLEEEDEDERDIFGNKIRGDNDEDAEVIPYDE